MPEDKKPIGKILLKRRLISPEELDSQLKKQANARDGIPLASRIARDGIVPETDVLRALSEQFGVPGIDLKQIAIPIEHLDLVPREVAESSRILPVLARDDRVFLAMANPRDKRVIDELEFVTGRRIYPYVAITTTLEQTIRAAYDAKDAGKRYYAGPNAPAQALERLGVDPRAAAAAEGGREPERNSVAPGEPAVVLDEQIEEAAERDELSVSDFGTLGEEVSKVEMVSDELKAAAAVVAFPKAERSLVVDFGDHAQKKPAPVGGAAKKRILVVDDEEDIRKLCRRLFTEKGYDVMDADRGLTALRMVKEAPPDLILLDAMLPEVHGFDIAKRIKGSEKYGNIPILMMSAVYRGWRIAEDLKSNYGIEDYIEKPFRIAELLEKVARLLEKKDSAPAPRDPEQINRNAAKYLEDGIAAYKNGEIELAVSMLKKGISIDPLAYRLRYHLALIYGKQGQFYDGITELERAVDLNPRHFAALKNLAVLYEKAGFKNKAVEMWERCVQVSPDAETREQIKLHLLKLL